MVLRVNRILSSSRLQRPMEHLCACACACVWFVCVCVVPAVAVVIKYACISALFFICELVAVCVLWCVPRVYRAFSGEHERGGGGRGGRAPWCAVWTPDAQLRGAGTPRVVHRSTVHPDPLVKYALNVFITEARGGGRVGNPRGLTAPGAGPGSARGRDSPRRPPARGRHSLPGVGPTHFGSNGSRF